jgi:hypothetical protein
VLSQQSQRSLEYVKWKNSILIATKSFSKINDAIPVARDTVFLNWVSSKKFAEMKRYMHLCDSSSSDSSFVLFHVNKYETPSCTVTFLPISHKKAKCILRFTSTEFHVGPIQISEGVFSTDILTKSVLASNNFGANSDCIYITRFWDNTVNTAIKQLDEETRSDFEKAFGNIW